MRRWPKVALMAFALATTIVFGGLERTAVAAGLERIVGTPVSLVPPAGLKLSKRFPGFELATSGAVITVFEMPDADFPQMLGLKDPAVLPSILESYGFPTTATTETLIINGREYVLVSAQMEIAGFDADSWMAITGPNPSVMLNFQQVHVPGVAPILDRGVTMETLQSVVLAGPTSFEDQLLTTGLILQALPPFTVSRTVAAGRIIMLSSSLDRSKDHDAAFVQVLLLPAGSEKVPLEVLGDHYARDQGGPITNVVQEERYFVGVKGVRLQGDRVSAEGANQQFIEYIAVVDGQAIVLLGVGRRSDISDEVLATIDKIAASVQKQPIQTPA